LVQALLAFGAPKARQRQSPKPSRLLDTPRALTDLLVFIRLEIIDISAIMPIDRYWTVIPSLRRVNLGGHVTRISFNFARFLRITAATPLQISMLSVEVIAATCRSQHRRWRISLCDAFDALMQFGSQTWAFWVRYLLGTVVWCCMYGQPL